MDSVFSVLASRCDNAAPHGLANFRLLSIGTWNFTLMYNDLLFSSTREDHALPLYASKCTHSQHCASEGCCWMVYSHTLHSSCSQSFRLRVWLQRTQAVVTEKKYGSSKFGLQAESSGNCPANFTEWSDVIPNIVVSYSSDMK